MHSGDRLITTILATREAHEPFAARRDHAILLDRLAGMAHDPFAQLFEFGAAGRAVE